MNIEFRDWLKSEIQYLEDFESPSVVEFRILKKLERTIKKYDELHRPVVIPNFVAEWIEDPYRSLDDMYAWERPENVYEWTFSEGYSLENSRLKDLMDAIDNGYEVEEDQKYYALIKGHELLADHDALSFTYWNFNMSNGYLLHGNQFSKQSRFLTKMTKEEWFELGINESNADFVKVEEIEE